jgi:hypothetical protein
VWNSKRFVGPEPFFVARLSQDEPTLVTTGMLADEHPNLRGYAWLTRAEVARLPDRVEPPSLVAVIRTLAPDTTDW